jgi:hypothetical protein
MYAWTVGMTVDQHLGVMLIKTGFDCAWMDIHDLNRFLHHCGRAVGAQASRNLLAFE